MAIPNSLPLDSEFAALIKRNHQATAEALSIVADLRDSIRRFRETRDRIVEAEAREAVEEWLGTAP